MKIIVITPPETVKDETIICNLLFDNGLHILHLRKPGADKKVYEDFIEQIDPRYRKRIVIHNHYELVRKYQLRGIHLRYSMASEHREWIDITHISVSCHSIEEIRHLPFKPTYCFLSPIFDSISKQGYAQKFDFNKLQKELTQLPHPIVALGGITPYEAGTCEQCGFVGVASLGYIWNTPQEAVQQFIRLRTPIVMSIAGFDSSSGAGVTADLKTFEATGSYGLGICSALTFQNQNEYTGTQWIALTDILRQCELQFRTCTPLYVKIGLIENFDILEQLVTRLIEMLPGVRIIWDPILKASAGYVFHTNTEKLYEVLKHIYLITPNSLELEQLFGSIGDVEALQNISQRLNINILWKGGHTVDERSADRLIMPTGVHTFSVQRSRYGKHGTGCVLSSAITSYLAQEASLPDACDKAQIYVSDFIESNSSNLGYHYLNATPPIPPIEKAMTVQYITDHRKNGSIAEQVDAVCRGGIRWIQLRMKNATEEEILREGRLVQAICSRYNAVLIINDHVEVARQLNAHGVHLGKQDMTPEEARKILGDNKIIGATCNDYEDVVLRAKQQVDYIGLGPFAFTTTKNNLSPILGETGYHEILRQMEQADIHIPVVAIGGITESDISPLMKTGIRGIALSSLIKNKENMAQQARVIVQLTEYI